MNSATRSAELGQDSRGACAPSELAGVICYPSLGQITPRVAPGVERAERSGRSSKPNNTLNELALFAGAGGGILGAKLLGWRTVCAVEIADYARRVLMARQDDGCLEPFPIWDDVRTFDGRPWRGVVDVVTGGFPCQDIAVGSSTKTGLSGERSGLWSEMARIIREVGPRFVVVENSAVLVARGLGRVLRDLAAMGYDARWGVFSAGDAGARHERERLFVVADSDGFMGQARPWTEQQHGQFADVSTLHQEDTCDCLRVWLEMARDRARVDDGLANQVDRTHAVGNGQFPAVVALAWNLLVGGGGAERQGEQTPTTGAKDNR